MPPVLPVATSELSDLLRAEYGLDANGITPFEIEHAPASFAAKVETRSGLALFLKFKRELAPGTLEVASLLHARSLPVLAPLPTLTNELSVRADGLSLLLYPLLDAHPVDQGSLSPTQWRDLGQALRCIHQTPLPEALLGTLPHASFVPWGELFLMECAEAFSLREKSLRELWDSHKTLLEDFFALTSQLGQAARVAAPTFHLCHNDFHEDNILLHASTGDLIIIDWDNALWGFRERDLLFIRPEHRPALEVGYGPLEEVAEAARYVHADWLLQDLLDCFSRLLSPEIAPPEKTWIYKTVANIVPRMLAFQSAC